MRDTLRTTLPVAAGTAAALLMLHRKLWRHPAFWRRPHGRVYGYVVGCGVLWGGFSVWCRLTGDGRAWRAYSALLAASGATVIGAWLWRGESAIRTDFRLFGHATHAVRTLPGSNNGDYLARLLDHLGLEEVQ